MRLEQQLEQRLEHQSPPPRPQVTAFAARPRVAPAVEEELPVVVPDSTVPVTALDLLAMRKRAAMIKPRQLRMQ